MQGQYIKWRASQSKRNLQKFLREELGLLFSLEAEIKLKEGTSPKFCKACPIPFTLHTQVEEELQRQVVNSEL